MRRLAYYLDRYASELEVDFASKFPGMDLGELWRTRQWRKLLNLIDHLPRNSFFTAAVANDDEHVEQIIAARERAGSEEASGPSLSEYDGVLERLDALVDATNQNTAATIAAAGAKAPRIPPQQRPVTAFERVAHRRKSAKHQSVVSRMLRKKEPLD
jgi:hypothetical protein